jgi:hypothetical protein
MALTQGSPLPDITQTTTRTDQAPDYYTNYLSGLSQAGQTAVARSPTQSVAGYDPMQVMGYSNLPGATTSYQPQLQAAQNTAAQAAQGITPERIQALMNPYTSNVVDEMGRLSQQNVQRNLLPTMKAGFVGTGGMGSQRYANALGQSMSDVQSNLTGQQYGALSKGYSEGLKGALDEAQLQNLAAGTQGKLAQQEMDMGLTGAGALTKAGAERQAYQQSLLDAPLKTATAASGLMRGYTVPQSQVEKFVGPKAGSYGTSDLSNILGVLSVLGSAAGGKGMSTVAGAGGSLIDMLKNAAGGGSSNQNIFGTFNVDPKEFTGGTNVNGVPVYFDNETGKYYGTDGKEVAVVGE